MTSLLSPATVHVDPSPATPSRGRPAGVSGRVAALVLLVIAGNLVWLGRYAMFTSTEYFDDEGDWLIGLQSFRQHGSLYHDTWSQCGPFYYDFWSVVFAVARAPVDISASRLVGLATWIAISLAGAGLVWSCTHRITLALLAEVTIFLVMEPLSGEPLEPAGLASLLVLSALVCGVGLRRRSPRVGAFVVGALVTATVLTKVNVGLFLLGGLLMAVLLGWPSSRWRRVRDLLAVGIIVGVPIALCSAIISRSWVRTYVELVVLSGTSVVVTVLGLRSSMPGVGRSDWGRPREVAWSFAGALAMAAAVTIVAVGTGTSLHELVRGALLAQRSLPSLFVGPLRPQPRVVLVSLLSVGVAVIPLLPSLRGHVSPHLRIAGRAAIGITIVVTSVGGLVVWSGSATWTDAQMLSALFQPTLTAPGPMALGSFQYGLPFAWVAIRRPGSDGVVHLTFQRCLIVSVAVLLALEGFPVAGHQLSWSVIGLLVVGVIILGDALMLASISPGPAHRIVMTRAVITVVAVLLVGSNLTEFTTNYRGLYSDNVKPALTGAGLVRWPPFVAADDEAVTKVLQTRCATFYGLPGLNSFYLFTGEQPPTGLLTTQWMYLMDTPTQQRVVEALRRVPRLCVLYYQPALTFWEDGKALPHTSPILRYMEDGFAPVASVNGYVILTRSRNGTLPSARGGQYLPDFRLPVDPDVAKTPRFYS
jgi:hypothetical protein